MTEPAHVLVADPGWKFNDTLPGPSRGAVKVYKTVETVEEIRATKLPPLHDDAVLLLWRVSSMVEEAYSVVRAWGFTPKSEMVWVKKTKENKMHFGMGRYVRGSHETCIIATRGRGIDLVQSHSVRSVFEDPGVLEAPVGPHSQKPELFYILVEVLFRGPYAELHARQRREGWSCYGDELPP